MSEAEPWERLRVWLEGRGVDVCTEAMERLRAHWELVIEENARQNLTSVTDLDEAVAAHYMDSLAVLGRWEAREVLDAGSGAGFPGVPLKILRPDWSMTLADSRLKRVRFLERTIAALGLHDCRAVHCRLDKPPADLVGRFSLILSRAMSSPRAAVRALQGLLAPAGVLVLYTGTLGDDETAALRREAQKRGLAALPPVEVALPGRAGHWLVGMRREA